MDRSHWSESSRMATSTAAPAVRAAFDALVDYAGLFPPARLPMAQATAEYAAARSGRHAWILGRFIISASTLVSAGASACDAPLSVIVDADPDPRQWFRSMQTLLESLAAFHEKRRSVEALEAPLPKMHGEGFDGTIAQLGAYVARAGLSDLPVYAEIPRGAGWTQRLPSAMAAASRAGLGAKLRCGGLTEDAFPSIDEVAQFVAAAAQAGVGFKATAGLHHPVRHRDAATGFPMHGFLNILAAAALAPSVDGETLRRIIAEEEPTAFTFDDRSFAWRHERVSVDRIILTRSKAFVAYGSCSFAEPVDDLTALGMLPRE
jgi:hypothetical protein